MLTQLSLELLFLIVDHLESDADISSFARTSQFYYGLIINLLYKNGEGNREGQALIWACQKGEKRTAELAMNHFNPDDLDLSISRYGESLCVASEQGHLTLVKIILHRIETLLDKWDPYDCDYWINEALANAAKHGHLSIAQLLVEKGAEVNAFAEDGPPLILAAAAGRGDVVRYLLAKGASHTSANKYGFTALNEAAQVGDVESVKTLLEYGAVVDAVGFRNEDRDTALLLASIAGHKDVVTLLLTKGANARHVNACDETALQLAEDFGHEGVARLLREWEMQMLSA
ncbi:ankyrin repeat-containing domain protein [Aspergillus spectabilis]